KRLEADLHEEIIAGEIEQSPEQLDRDERKAEQGNQIGRVTETRIGIPRKDVVDDDLERPRLHETQCDRGERKNQTERGLRRKRPVISEDAAVNRHENLRLQIADFRSN